MILKDADDRAADIAELKRLKESSPSTFHAAIQKQIDNIYSGIAGERDAAHFINREFGSSKRMAVLHDLRIGHNGDFAQIDHLVIHRFQGTAWVLETKNYAGRLSCDEHGDWTIWSNGKPRPIQSPINQARRHCETLRLWLKAEGIKSIHSIQPVVLISPTSSINRKKLDPGDHVVKSDNFGKWWDKQYEGLGIGTMLGMIGRHALNGMSSDDLRLLGYRLARAHSPASFDWRAILRLPRQPAGQAAPALPQVEAAAVQQTITTPHGNVQVNRLPDGRYAIRNDRNDLLIEVIRSACKGIGQWNPRYKNWIVSEADLPGIVAKIS